mgnify:CR=1 FL=1
MADKDKSLAEKYAKDCGAMLSIKSVISNKTVSFMAFLNDYTDTFNSNWNTEEVFGRMDPVAMFKSTKRTLSIGWNVPSTSLEQAKKHRNKVARLSKMIYPAYNNSGMKHQQTLTKPPLVKVRYANLLRNTAGSGGQLGWIDNLSIKPETDLGFFTSGKKLYPKVWTLSISFNVLHQHDVGVNNSGGWLGGRSWPF